MNAEQRQLINSYKKCMEDLPMNHSTQYTESGTNKTLPHALLERLPAPVPEVRRRILYFMRSIYCPVCRSHVKCLAELSGALRVLKADIVVLTPPVGASQARKWIARQPFQVLATDDAHAAAGLGRVIFGTIQQSGTLVVGLDGSILLARRATVPFRSFDQRSLLTHLRETVGTRHNDLS
jgi:peroxiredoxin